MRTKLGIFALTCLLVASPVRCQVVALTGPASADTSTINVIGLGEVLAAPARAVVFISVGAEDASPEAAAATNADLRGKVVQALAAAGFGSDRVALYGYAAGARDPRRVVGPAAAARSEFESKAGLRVIVEPVDRLDEVVGVALRAGAEGVPMVQFEVGDAAEARREAVAAAVANARSSAEAIAAAAGGRLGSLRIPG